MDELVSFGNVVRSHRLALGISQEELADRAGLHRTYIGSIERGERNVSIINIYAIARALGTKPSVLLTQADDLIP
jgi:transcriptional regulator with XRE-family HTH domain